LPAYIGYTNFITIWYHCKKRSILLLSKSGVLLLIPVILMFFNHSYSNVSFLIYGQITDNNTITNTNIANKDTNATINSASNIGPAVNLIVGSIITFSNSPSSNSTGQTPTMELNNSLNNSNNTNNSNILTSHDALTNTSEVNGNLPSSSSLPPLDTTNAENMTGAQEGDGQEIDTGHEADQALTVQEAQALKANLVIPGSSPFKSDQCTPNDNLEKFVPNPFMKDLGITRFIVRNCITITGK
jgi:hypothetical protein